MIRVVGDIEGDILLDLQNLSEGAKPAARAAFERFVARVVPQAQALTPDDPDTDGGASGSWLGAGGGGGGPEGVDLKRSVRGRVTVKKSGMVTASVMAGGDPLLQKLRAEGRKNPSASLAYAFVQHEDPTQRHTSGQANFIGQPFQRESMSVPADLDREIMSRAG